MYHNRKTGKTYDQVITKEKIQTPSKCNGKSSFPIKLKKTKDEFAKMTPLFTYQIGKDIKNTSICYTDGCVANLLLWYSAGGNVNVYNPPMEKR